MWKTLCRVPRRSIWLPALAGLLASATASRAADLFGDIKNAGRDLNKKVNEAVNHVDRKVNEAAKHVDRKVNEAERHVEGKVREGLREIDPVVAARRRFEAARAEAERNLRKLDPREILARVQAAINQQVHNELRKNGSTWNERTGEVDLRGTSMGRSLEHWLDAFAQGNKGDGRVDAFTFNVRTRRLEVRLTAKHAHSWGRIIPGQPPVDLYSITQHAMFRYDFRSNSGQIKIDAGRLAPPMDTKTYERLSEGDLVAVAETLSPRVVGDVVNYERVNRYDEVRRELQARYGAENVFLASKSFVDWASPNTLGRYAVTGVLTAGASVYPQFMRDVQRQSQHEIPALTAWLSRRGMGNAQGVARELITGGVPRWPFLKFEIVPVRYSAREKPLHAFTTPWRHIDHLAFVVVWDDRARSGPDAGTLAAADRIIGLTPDERSRRQPPAMVDRRTALRPPNGQASDRSLAGETFASNLGIYYAAVRYGDGTFGARVTRPPASNAPAAQLGFEPGDVIFELDGQRFRRPEDVLAHRYQTTVKFINVRTNAPQSGSLTLP